VNGAPDEYRLEDIALDHKIGVGVFIPFVIARLQGEEQATEVVLTVTLRDVDNAGDRQKQLRLFWASFSGPSQPLGVQERTVTEWAALGLACVVLARYTTIRVSQVAGDGDRFDYWVSDGEREYGLEVSGTMTDEVETRHRIKVRQLRENPYGVDGYVIVAGFAGYNIICSFHRFEEEVQ
jgi:hypothetical protein